MASAGKAYTVFISTAAERDLSQLKNKTFVGRIDRAIKALGKNPRSSGVEKLAGADQSYRKRVGDYRILFEIDDSAKKVTVFRVRNRRDVYKH